MTSAIDSANFEGTFWKDIDWDDPLHQMKTCTCCGADAGDVLMAGHLSSCYYGTGAENAGAFEFFRDEIEKALKRISAKREAKTMKWKLPSTIILIFIGGMWGGWVVKTWQVGMFGYTPCWSTFSDVYGEYRYQKELGFAAGWKFSDPDIEKDCELVNPRRKWKGYKRV